MDFPIRSWPGVRQQIYERIRAGQTQFALDADEDIENPQMTTLKLDAHSTINSAGE